MLSPPPLHERSGLRTIRAFGFVPTGGIHSTQYISGSDWYGFAPAATAYSSSATATDTGASDTMDFLYDSCVIIRGFGLNKINTFF